MFYENTTICNQSAQIPIATGYMWFNNTLVMSCLGFLALVIIKVLML